jgi:two-component system, LytTR family, response regulator
MNNKIRTLIIEDEEPARQLLRSFLSGLEHIDVIGECADGFTGLKAINENKPDLIFLDIQMPKLTGFELLELLDEMPEVVFTTAYDQYALQAFELNAVDYLMKPFSRERLRIAVDKVVERCLARNTASSSVSQLTAHLHEQPPMLERIVVKTGTKIEVIPLAEIEQIEAQDDYVMIYTDKARYLKKETLNYFEKALPATDFIRIHRSHIVNMKYIKQIEQYGKESYVVVLSNGKQVNISKSRFKDLKQELGF